MSGNKNAPCSCTAGACWTPEGWKAASVGEELSVLPSDSWPSQSSGAPETCFSWVPAAKQQGEEGREPVATRNSEAVLQATLLRAVCTLSGFTVLH